MCYLRIPRIAEGHLKTHLFWVWMSQVRNFGCTTQLHQWTSCSCVRRWSKWCSHNPFVATYVLLVRPLRLSSHNRWKSSLCEMRINVEFRGYWKLRETLHTCRTRVHNQRCSISRKRIPLNRTPFCITSVIDNVVGSKRDQATPKTYELFCSRLGIFLP